MPVAVLSAERLLSVVGRSLSHAEVDELLFSTKAELKRWEGDELEVEATPDRLDLLDEGGLGLHLQGALGAATGLVPVRSSTEGAGVRFLVEPSVDPLRPSIAGAVVTAPDDSALDQGLLDEAVRFQELLHATVGMDRRLASLGIYPLERLRSPVRYALEPASGVRFVPLDGTESVDAPSFFNEHPLGRKYGPLGRSGDRCLTLRDVGGEVLSLPPALNARGAGEARSGDRRLLLESTGTRPARVRDSVALLLLPFVARGWSVAPVQVEGPGARADDGWSTVSPRPLHLGSVPLAAVAGAAYSPTEVEGWVARARLGVVPEIHGYRVDAPPWRPDLLGEIDVIEEVILTRGVRAEDGILPSSPTRGRRLPEARFRRRVRELLLGLGYAELCTPVLVPASTVGLLERRDALALQNPVSEQFAFLRDRVEVSLLGTLERNVRHGYPQRFAEVGPVLVRDDSSESGATTRYHAGAFLASDTAGFADGAALLDYLLGAFGAIGVREPTELSGTIPGRAARLKIAGERIGEVGELHPAVLDALRVPVPVVWSEVDLTALWPLVRRGEAD